MINLEQQLKLAAERLDAAIKRELEDAAIIATVIKPQQ